MNNKFQKDYTTKDPLTVLFFKIRTSIFIVLIGFFGLLIQRFDYIKEKEYLPNSIKFNFYLDWISVSLMLMGFILYCAYNSQMKIRLKKIDSLGENTWA